MDIDPIGYTNHSQLNYVMNENDDGLFFPTKIKDEEFGVFTQMQVNELIKQNDQLKQILVNIIMTHIVPDDYLDMKSRIEHAIKVAKNHGIDLTKELEEKDATD